MEAAILDRGQGVTVHERQIQPIPTGWPPEVARSRFSVPEDPARGPCGRRDVLVRPSPWPQHVPKLWPSPGPLAPGRAAHGHPEPDAPPGASEAAACASGPHSRPAAAEGSGAAHVHPKAQEAQLGQPQVLPRAAQHGPRGRVLHPWRGPQPAGAPCRAAAGRPHPGPAWREAHCGAWQVRLRPRAEEEVTARATAGRGSPAARTFLSGCLLYPWSWVQILASPPPPGTLLAPRGSGCELVKAPLCPHPCLPCVQHGLKRPLLLGRALYGPLLGRGCNKRTNPPPMVVM